MQIFYISTDFRIFRRKVEKYLGQFFMPRKNWLLGNKDSLGILNFDHSSFNISSDLRCFFF